MNEKIREISKFPMEGFDAEKYERLMSESIASRIDRGGGRMYLEVGGHLFFDSHASRVLPGFNPMSKLLLLSRRISVRTSSIVCVHAAVLEENGVTANSKESARATCINLVEALRSHVGCSAIVVTRVLELSEALLQFGAELRNHFVDLQVVFHRVTPGYPHNLAAALAGFESNEQIKIDPSVQLCLVSGVQANSGKLATCLSQLYKEKNSIYSKLELFPIHDLPASHPSALAYEAATSDVGDVVMPDPFCPGSTNYNRDIEAFPLVRELMKHIVKDSDLMNIYYSSPTAMGLNRASEAITNAKVCEQAALREVGLRFLMNRGVAKQRCAELLKRNQLALADLLPASQHQNALWLSDERLFVIGKEDNVKSDDRVFVVSKEEQSSVKLSSCARLVLAAAGGKVPAQYDWCASHFRTEPVLEKRKLSSSSFFCSLRLVI